MNMEEKDFKQFSKELSQVMDDIGINEEMVSLRRHVSLLIDRCMSICFNFNRSSYKFFTFGSQSEGSTTIGMNSDFDRLFYHEIHNDCVHLSDYQASKLNYYVIQEPTSLPQCCCLPLVGVLGNRALLPKDIGTQFIIDEQGRWLLNPTHYLDMLLESFENSKMTRHGPACTYHETTFDNEYVWAVRCLSLPDNCKVLFTRQRPGHWPKQETLLKAEQCEVYMVNPGVKGHISGYNNERRFGFIKLQYQNTYADKQFRMSTNMIERLLMFDLNIVQMKAYVITKMIRKEFLQSLVDERLSTFHMKTALLFTIEQFPENIWRDDNLVQCVIFCLNTLRRFLKRCYCPHYTISSVNLFAEKLPKNELEFIKEKLTEMIKSSLRCLQTLRMDDVGCRLSAGSLGSSNENILSATGIRFEIIIKMLRQLRNDHPQPYGHTYKKIKTDILEIKSAITPDCEYKDELEFMFQSMCSNAASQEASDCIANRMEVTSDIIEMYEISLGSKDITNHLRYASMLVCTRQYEHACALLETIENMIASGVNEISELSKLNIDVKHESDQRSSKCSSKEILMKYAAKNIFPIVFFRSEIKCVPVHLINEKDRAITDDEIKCAYVKIGSRFINHVFKADAKAFLYYLQYMSANNIDKKKIAFEKLSDYCECERKNRTSDHLATAQDMLNNVVELEHSLTHAMDTSQTNSGVNNIVIRNFPERANENVKDRVNSLLKNVLKVNISIKSAERKKAKSGTENGVIIAVCKSRDDKDTVMKSESKLRLSRAYSSVYIENDMTQKERNYISNLRTLAHVIGKDKVNVQGNKLLVRDQTGQRTNTGGDCQRVTYRRDRQSMDIRRGNTPATSQYRNGGHCDTFATRTSENGYCNHGREQGGGDRDHLLQFT
ncbi:hypothetical protein DPMN_143228 [Dreissena polymorpha]|uniref:Mab-21-like HhH/H2TH-like domain-containing protein n=1 Tax=Dreissena polymorpha TaxID=45954 RepID=A0A9D4GCQ5_DREPO|nr:hypothetical protein DPMN_143228 [Dreissena polymorpha]